MSVTAICVTLAIFLGTIVVHEKNKSAAEKKEKEELEKNKKRLKELGELMMEGYYAIDDITAIVMNYKDYQSNIDAITTNITDAIKIISEKSNIYKTAEWIKILNTQKEILNSHKKNFTNLSSNLNDRKKDVEELMEKWEKETRELQVLVYGENAGNVSVHPLDPNRDPRRGTKAQSTTTTTTSGTTTTKPSTSTTGTTTATTTTSGEKTTKTGTTKKETGTTTVNRAPLETSGADNLEGVTDYKDGGHTVQEGPASAGDNTSNSGNSSNGNKGNNTTSTGNSTTSSGNNASTSGTTTSTRGVVTPGQQGNQGQFEYKMVGGKLTKVKKN